LEFLYHPGPPAFTAGEVAEHFHVIVIGTTDCEHPMKERLEGIEIQPARCLTVLGISPFRHRKRSLTVAALIGMLRVCRRLQSRDR
jgi:hypothetical protein